MAEIVTLELSEDVLRRARAVATRTGSRLEAVLEDWIARTAEDLPVESLPDNEVLRLCDLQLDDHNQAELSRLLTSNREHSLTAAERAQLDDLMTLYRRGLVRKAQAWKVAVERGLRPPLS